MTSQKKTFWSLFFSTEKILKALIKDCFKNNGKQIIMMPNKSEYDKFKNLEGIMKSPFMVYAEFESFLV